VNAAPRCPETLTLRCGPITAVELALYAASSGDLNPLHLDAEVARAAGFERPIVHGMYTMACAGRLFGDTFGAAALRSLNTRFVGAALLGDTLVLNATLSGVAGGVASYDLRGETGAGTPVVTGSARVSLA